MLNCKYNLNDFYEKYICVKVNNYTQYEELESWFCNMGIHIDNERSNHEYTQDYLLDSINVAIAVFYFPISESVELFPVPILNFDDSWQMVQFNELFNVIEINQSQLEELLL